MQNEERPVSPKTGPFKDQAHSPFLLANAPKAQVLEQPPDVANRPADLAPDLDGFQPIPVTRPDPRDQALWRDPSDRWGSDEWPPK